MPTNPNSTTLLIDADLPPKVLHPNARASWRAVASAKKKYRKHCGEATWIAYYQSGQFRPGVDLFTGPVRVSLTYHLPRPKRGGFQPHDTDNAIAWAKAAIDGLQDGHVIANDRQVTMGDVRQRMVEVGERTRLEITVEEIEA